MLIQLLCFRFHALEHILRLLAAPHHDDAFHCVIGLVEAELAQPRRIPDLHLPNVPDARGHAVLRAHYDIRNVRRVAHQTRARHVIELLPLLVKSAAGIRVVHRELLYHRRHGHVIRVKLSGIEKHLVLHHGAAKTGVVRHTGHLLELPLHHPVFDRLEFLR